jgi:NTP pyrophosphatase (non-canonical NTP hydrolase)
MKIETQQRTVEKCSACRHHHYSILARAFYCGAIEGTRDLEDRTTIPDWCPLPEATSTQEQVAAAVAARGYREGWTAEQFAYRQMLKMQEELGELARHMAKYHRSEGPEGHIRHIGKNCGEWFDLVNEGGWVNARVVNVEGARAELADIQVVVFALAAALSEIDGEPFDVVQAALAKATKDIERGTR